MYYQIFNFYFLYNLITSVDYMPEHTFLQRLFIWRGSGMMTCTAVLSSFQGIIVAWKTATLVSSHDKGRKSCKILLILTENPVNNAFEAVIISPWTPPAGLQRPLDHCWSWLTCYILVFYHLYILLALSFVGHRSNFQLLKKDNSYKKKSHSRVI